MRPSTPDLAREIAALQAQTRLIRARGTTGGVADLLERAAEELLAADEELRLQRDALAELPGLRLAAVASLPGRVELELALVRGDPDVAEAVADPRRGGRLPDAVAPVAAACFRSGRPQQVADFSVVEPCSILALPMRGRG